MTDRNDISNENPCLHFEAKLVPDLCTKIKKRLITGICDLKQPCSAHVSLFLRINMTIPAIFQ